MYVYVCIYVCMYVCMYVYVCIYVYIHTHTHTYTYYISACKKKSCVYTFFLLAWHLSQTFKKTTLIRAGSKKKKKAEIVKKRIAKQKPKTL